MRKIFDFILQPSSLGNRKWFNDLNYKVYIRNCPYRIDDKTCAAIVVAVIEVDPTMQRRRIGSNLIYDIHHIHDKEATVIESCHHELFHKYLVGNNWRPMVDNPLNLYLMK